MPRKHIDKHLEGQTFGFLTVVKFDKVGKYSQRFWICKCICGNEISAYEHKILSGHTKSCGCYQKKIAGLANFKDLTGSIFGRLTVIKQSGYSNTAFPHILWECLCTCGNVTNVGSYNLTHGITKSCGCYKSEIVKTAPLKHGHCKNGKDSPEFTAWMEIKKRCYNKKNKAYKHYGGRGIKMSDEWLNNFPLFLAQVGLKPSPRHSLDRKDNNGNYEFGNVRWATPLEQAGNKRNNRWIEYKGINMILADWARYFNVDSAKISDRLKRNGNDIPLLFEELEDNRIVYAKSIFKDN